MNNIKAVIFDMDGVIIDSEPLWKKAEKEVFSSLGVKLTPDLCKITDRMTTKAVTQFWFEKYPWQGKSLVAVEHSVINKVAELIQNEGKAIPGVHDLILKLKAQKLKIGLATNSPALLIPVVLEQLKLVKYFDCIASSEHELEGKPSPFVYQSALRELNTEAKYGMAIEDSSSGLLAAKKAGLKTVGLNVKKNSSADYHINNYESFDMSWI